MKEMKSKKAEITSKELVTLIVLVVSFAIILIFWSLFSWKGQINDETCHTSVIIRKTMLESPNVLGSGKIVDVPLKCKAERKCLVKGSDSGCSNLGKEYDKVSISSEEDIMKEIADSMAECWSMMGEGKEPQVFSDKLSEPGYYSVGVICEIISFSDNVQNEYPSISSARLNRYMNEHKFSNKDITYWQYLTNQNNEKDPEMLATDDAFTSGKIETKNPYAVVFVEFHFGKMANVIGSFSGAILGAAVTPKLGFTIGLGASLGAATVFERMVEGYKRLINIDEGASSIFFVPYDGKNLVALNVNSFENIA